jgi:hypothetical protein
MHSTQITKRLYTPHPEVIRSTLRKTKSKKTRFATGIDELMAAPREEEVNQPTGLQEDLPGSPKLQEDLPGSPKLQEDLPGSPKLQEDLPGSPK